MALNFNILQPLGTSGQSNEVAQSAPSSNNSLGDVGDALSGLGGLIGARANNAATPSHPQSNFSIPSVSAPNMQNQAQALTDNMPYMKVAESMIGQNEHTPGLAKFLQKSNPNLDPSLTPWCAGFVNATLQASGIQGTGSLAAKSYLKFGEPVSSPSEGDIVVFNDMSGRNDPDRGHVGFVKGIVTKNGNPYVRVLGGNQADQVIVKDYPMSAVAGFRRPPTGQQVKQFAQQNNITNPQQLATLVH